MTAEFLEARLPPRPYWPRLAWVGDGAPNFPARANFASLVMERALRNGHANSVAVYDPAPHSYAELFARACNYSNRLRKAGVGRGDRVLLRAANGFDAIAAWLGVLQAGAVAVTVLPTLRARELVMILNAAGVRSAVCAPELRADLEAASERAAEPLGALIELNDASLDAEEASFEPVVGSADDPALVAFTSGTTGTPKAAVHSHSHLIATCEAYGIRTVGLSSVDRVAALAPLAFTYGLGALVLFPLWASAAAVVAASPEALLSLTQELRITSWFLTPSVYRVLPRFVSRFDLSSLKRCISAGETLPASVFRDFLEQTGIRIADGLGTTEMLHIFLGGDPESAEPGITGTAVPGYEVRVIDDADQFVGPNVLGRLTVRGPTGCRYLSNENAQRAYVVDGWNVTGDLVAADEQGRIHYHSRVDDLIISDGMNVAAAEVEDVLLQHSGIQECVVVGIKETQDGSQVVAAVVVPKSNNVLRKEELLEFLKRELAVHKQPRRFVFAERLPRTPTGKVQRRHIRQLVEDGFPLNGET